MVKASRSSIQTGSFMVDQHRSRSLGQSVQRVAIACDDVLSLGHLLFESRIVGREPVTAVGSLDQKKGRAIAAVQAMNDLFWQDNTQGVPEFTDFEFHHG